jgi:hypothetical protein
MLVLDQRRLSMTNLACFEHQNKAVSKEIANQVSSFEVSPNWALSSNKNLRTQNWE